MTEALQKAERENEMLRDVVCNLASAWAQVSDALVEEMDNEDDDEGIEDPWPYRVAKDMVSEIDRKYSLQDLRGAWRALPDDETKLLVEGRLTSDQFSPEDKAKIVEHFLPS